MEIIDGEGYEGDGCPVCHALTDGYDSYDFYDDYDGHDGSGTPCVCYRYTCPGCGRRWTEVYRLDHVEVYD